MDMRLSQVFNHLDCSNISPKRSVHFSYLGFPFFRSYKKKENQTNTELQTFISEPQTSGKSFEMVVACFVCMYFTDDIKA